MQLLYNISLRFYYLLILASSPFNIKAKQWINGRKNFFKYLQEKTINEENIIWIHVSSLGEFEQGRPVIEEIKALKQDYKILLTFFSPSGYEIRKNYEGADFIFYLPLDTKRNAKRFLSIVKPKKVIFVKYEFWYHFLHQLKLNNIPTYLISAVFRPKQVFFKWYGKWYRKTLKSFEHLFVQNKESENLLNNIGINKVSITGDTRFDRVNEISKNTIEIPLVKKFKGSKKLIVAGSTWEKDESFLIKYILNTSNEVKFIIAPHEIHNNHVCSIMKELPNNSIRFSEANEKTISNFKVLVIDNIGMLSSLYKYGDLAYIGGGFGKGIHNILEPAGFGLPVIFGPNYKKFQEAIDIISINGSKTFNTYNELEKILSEFINDNKLLFRSSEIVNEYFNSKLGATKLIIKKCFNN